jgi:hypothetical protein
MVVICDMTLCNVGESFGPKGRAVKRTKPILGYSVPFGPFPHKSRGAFIFNFCPACEHLGGGDQPGFPRLGWFLSNNEVPF